MDTETTADLRARLERAGFRTGIVNHSRFGLVPVAGGRPLWQENPGPYPCQTILDHISRGGRFRLARGVVTHRAVIGVELPRRDFLHEGPADFNNPDGESETDAVRLLEACSRVGVDPTGWPMTSNLGPDGAWIVSIPGAIL